MAILFLYVANIVIFCFILCRKEEKRGNIDIHTFPICIELNAIGGIILSDIIYSSFASVNHIA